MEGVKETPVKLTKVGIKANLSFTPSPALPLQAGEGSRFGDEMINWDCRKGHI